MNNEQTITIYGNEWPLSDVENLVYYCLPETWSKREWKRSPALVDKTGTGMRLYDGLGYNEDIWDLVPDAWTHDHCNICMWTLAESSDPEVGTGWTNGTIWLCNECYETLVLPAQTAAKLTAES